MNKVFARVMQGMENQCSFFNPVKAIQDSQMKYLDRRISMAYAIWHLLEVSDNYETCQKFCELTEEILKDDDKLIDLNDDKSSEEALKQLEQIDDDTEAVGVKFIKTNDAAFVELYGIDSFPTVIYFENGS